MAMIYDFKAQNNKGAEVDFAQYEGKVLMIVSLTGKGKALQEKLSCVPVTMADAVLCDSVTPETAPELFRMLDDIIGKLSAR